MKLKRIGIVGCGAIGSKIAEAISSDLKDKAKLSALYDIDPARARDLAGKLRKKNIIVLSLARLIRRSDLVVEASSAASAADIARQALRNRRDCLIMSAGGLLGAGDIFDLARGKNCSVYLPSGAIAGIDALKAHKLTDIRKVTLTTRKSPQALSGAPYVIQKKIDLDSIKEETIIFEGSAQKAVTFFPQNINVAALLSLAGIGKEKTRVKIVCSPDYSRNIHEIEIESRAGNTFIRCENSPCPDNPKTSYLAVLSAIAALKEIFEPVKIGT
ncbi:MAG: aspartate dehydrogenase [Candidatus Omnitrophota bacterium]